mgnify:CR=1 FL=1
MGNHNVEMLDANVANYMYLEFVFHEHQLIFMNSYLTFPK